MALNLSMPDEADGRRDAMRYVDGRLSKIVAAFRSQTTRNARRGFADCALHEMAKAVEQAWTMIYEIAVIANEQKLHRAEIKDGKTFVSFEAWFSDRVGDSVITWEELEGLYQFVERDSSSLKSAPLSEVREHADMARVRDGDIGLGGGMETRMEQEMLPGSTTGSSLTPRQRADAYWMRRLEYYAPEVARAYQRGEYPSAREAAIAARLIKILTPDEQVKSLWRWCTIEERRELLRWLEKHKDDQTLGSSGAA